MQGNGLARNLDGTPAAKARSGGFLVPQPRSANADHSSATDELDWPALIAQVMDDPDRLTLLFQPIVSLAEATIVGYETLARFAPPAGLTPEQAKALTPDRWFDAADRLGVGAPMEAIVVSRCLALRNDLPDDCFLTFNVSPHLITDPALLNTLLEAGPLNRLIVEFTEHRDVPDLTPLVEIRDHIAELGGLLALDDAGTGYSGLTQMTRLRPHLIKLDRALVVGADQDEVKLALAELLGEFAGRIDAWLLAEGVETWGELDAFARIGVPLVQGYLLGRPAPPWARLDPLVIARLKVSTSRTYLKENAASVVELIPMRELGDPESAVLAAGQPLLGTIELEIDEHQRPVELIIHERDGPRRAPISMRVAPSDAITVIVQRFVTRPIGVRFDPVVCIDERGQAIGIIRVERLITQLLHLKSGNG